MEGRLNTPEGDRVAHARFDEVGQGFTLLEHGLEFGAKLGFDTDLGDDGGLHRCSVLRVSYTRNRLRLGTGCFPAANVNGAMSAPGRKRAAAQSL